MLVLVQDSYVLVQEFHVLVHGCHVIVQDWYKTVMYWYKTVMYWYKTVMYCTRQSCTDTRPSCTVQDSHVLVHKYLVPEQDCYVLVQDILYWNKTVMYCTRQIHDKNIYSTSCVQASTCNVQEMSKLVQDILASCTLLVLCQNTSKYKISCTSTR